MEILWPNAARPLALATDEAHVWAVRLRVTPEVWSEMWAALVPDERQRAEAFHFDDPRRRFVVARGALRRLLGEYLNLPPGTIELTFDDHGKPRLAVSHSGTDLHFNLSHSGDLALVVVTACCEVGIDVEQVRNVGHMEQIARRFFHPAEVDQVLTTSLATRNEAFFRCWTAKEAVLKGIGTGILGSLSSFEVPVSEHPAAWIETPTAPLETPSRCWLQQLSPCAGYKAAVAFLAAKCRVRCYTLSD